MISRVTTSFHKKKKPKTLELKQDISEIKKENWKTSESTIKKLKQYRNDPEKILERFRKVHRKKFDYSKVKYAGLTKKIIIICKKHGEFQTTPRLHLGRDSKNVYKKRDAVGCSECVLDDVINDFQIVHGKKYDYSKIKLKYKSFPMIIICPEHGEFKLTLTKHMNGTNCPMCSSIKN
tara:strand:- start:8 stop:541 length:534 start_codon:yes stop_codon:yes gene_type:complete